MNKPIIASPQVTNHILHRFKLRADKKLGQNFLIDENIVRRIVEAAELSPADKVLEVGPGIGTLTQGLAESGADVVAVELDKRLLPVLDVTLEGYDNVRIVNGDILQVNIMETVAAPEFKVCANLPYYITTPIIFALLEKRLPMERLVAMVQKEVADKMLAEPGDEDYGPLAIRCQYFCDPYVAMDVPAACFTPVPKVDSAFVILPMREEPPVQVHSEKTFFRVAAAAFAMRRKTMVNNLCPAFQLTREEACELMRDCGLDERIRGERLTMADFALLANKLDERSAEA